MAEIPGLWMLVAGTASALLVILLLAAARLTVDPIDWANPLFLAGGVLAIALCYLLRRPANRWQRMARDFGEFFGLFSIVCLLGTLASYAAAVISTGYHDAQLQHVDRLLGFDWLAWYDLVTRHAALQMAGRLVYHSIFLTPALILGYCVLFGETARARRFIATYWVAAILTLALFLFLPAKGPLAYLWHGPIPYMPVSALDQAELIEALRSRALTAIPLGDLRGLVCSPSFHTSSAILFIAAAWRIRPLRWPITALNLAMLLSTPVEGTHYLIDMIGGALVALAAMAVMSWMLAALARARPTGPGDFWGEAAEIGLARQ